MPDLSYLLQNYSEENWSTYWHFFEPQTCPTGIVDDDIWTALKFLVSPDDAIVFAWLDSKIPALSGLTPLKVLMMPKGGKLLRAMIMRMPC